MILSLWKNTGIQAMLCSLSLLDSENTNNSQRQMLEMNRLDRMGHAICVTKCVTSIKSFSFGHYENFMQIHKMYSNTKICTKYNIYRSEEYFFRMNVLEQNNTAASEEVFGR